MLAVLRQEHRDGVRRCNGNMLGIDVRLLGRRPLPMSFSPRYSAATAGIYAADVEETPARAGALAHTTGFSSPADLDAGSSGARAGNAGAFTVGDNFDPERVLGLEVRGGVGLA